MKKSSSKMFPLYIEHNRTFRILIEKILQGKKCIQGIHYSRNRSRAKKNQQNRKHRKIAAILSLWDIRIRSQQK